MPESKKQESKATVKPPYDDDDDFDDEDELDDEEPEQTNAELRALALVEAEEEAVKEYESLSSEERQEAFYLRNQRTVSD